LLDEPLEVMQGLRHLRYQMHEVLVFHVLDDDEITFPFTQLTQFEDLEDETRVITDPRAIAADYQEQMQQFIKEYETMCRRQSIDYTLFNTRTPLDKGLLKYLAWRGA
jgi:regulatory protein YycI of two-component signal transduction system YycFG